MTGIPGSGAARPASRGAAGFQVYRPALPCASRGYPNLMVFTGDADGRCEVFTWDSATRRRRQVTDRPHGTLHCAIDADATVWWFDEGRDGVGSWQVQDFGGGADRPAFASAPAGRHRGLAMSEQGTVALGIGDQDGTTLRLGLRDGPAEAVHRTADPASLVDLSPRADLLVLGRRAADARAVTVLSADGETVATLPGDHGRVWALGFAPGTAEAELLVVAERGQRYLLGSWTLSAGLVLHEWCGFDTEITASWYPDGSGVLVRQDRHGRSRLFRAVLPRRSLEPIDVPAGTLLDASPQAHADVHYLWTDTVTPPQSCSLSGTPLPQREADAVRVPGRALDLWTPGPDGPVHTLLTVPETRPAPHPTVFLVHGGPASHDRDAYDPAVHSLVASGFAVARVNYRGSTGYGPAWRAALTEGVGLTQLADLAAVRADLLARGLARPDAVGLWGTSWGGYLVLLALGTQPELWQAGVAVKPVADCAAAFHSGTAALRALDASLFGGTPDQVPERYARSSPSSYVDAVRAPVLVVAGRRDVKCPPEQVESYLAALRARGVRHEEVWLDSGHDGRDGGDHVEVLRRALEFLARGLRGPKGGNPRLLTPSRVRAGGAADRPTAPQLRDPGRR